jgi:sugar phosphate isomerase/epimerase
MPTPISIQLYTVRNVITERDYASVVKEIADIGYTAVEPAGFPKSSAAEAAAIFRDLGLQVSSGHFPMPIGDAKNQVLDDARTIGCTHLVSGKGPDDYKTPDLVKQTCDDFNQAAAVAAENNMQFSIHNHWWEFETVDGQRPFDRMLEYLNPNVGFQVDTYWVKIGGSDPAEIVKQLGPRAPLLHIKDGPGVKGEPHLAAGSGVMDFAAIDQAGGDNSKWWIIELDDCATDMMEAVRQSYVYLTGEGLATGNK